MSLDFLKTALVNATTNEESLEAWLVDQQTIGEKIAIFREYADGNHRANLTTEMKAMLRIADSGSFSEFNDNYADVIVQTMKNRLSVSSIKTDTEAGDGWVQELLDANRFDGLQVDITESTIRDGQTYLYPVYDKKTESVKLVHELAYDGVQGVLVKYERVDLSMMQFAAKIWYESTAELNDTVRVTITYKDRIERYMGKSEGQLRPFSSDGVPPVQYFPQPFETVPVLHFRNRMKRYTHQGLSEIENMIPLQDALNRTLISTVMTSELTAFQIRYSIGFDPPAAISPGMIMKISPESPLTNDENVEIGTLEQGTIDQQLAFMHFLRMEIANITQTPAPELLGGDTASGEALKQREVAFIGKCNTFQVKNGNVWEDAIEVAAEWQRRFSNQKPPAFTKATCKWDEPQVRNDKEVVEMALMIADKIDEKTFLELIAPIFKWDNDKVQEILDRKDEEATTNITRLTNQIPTFTDFGTQDFETNNTTLPPENGANNGQPELVGINA